MTTWLRDISAVATALLLFCIVACDNEGCEGNQSSLPLAGFYSSATKDAIGIDSLTVYGVGVPGDSAIIHNRSTVTQVYLPFDVDAASSRFVFRYEQKAFADLDITDTITVAYESRPYFHSKDCGAMYVFDIQSIETSHYLIDSVRVLTPTIDNTNSENIRIYFRTEEADEE